MSGNDVRFHVERRRHLADVRGETVPLHVAGHVEVCGTAAEDSG